MRHHLGGSRNAFAGLNPAQVCLFFSSKCHFSYSCSRQKVPQTRDPLQAQAAANTFAQDFQTNFPSYFPSPWRSFGIYYGQRGVKYAQPVCGCVQGTHKAAHKIAEVPVGSTQGYLVLFWVLTELMEFVAVTSTWCLSCTCFVLNIALLLMGFPFKRDRSVTVQITVRGPSFSSL